MDKGGNAWSVPVTVEDIPDTGLHMEIEAPAAARGELARLADIRDLSHLSAVFDLTRLGAGVRVAGQVKGVVGQICVVSLEPIETAVSEQVDLRFFPRPDGTEPDTANTAGGAEQPEPLVEGKVDLGALATEFLILGIDPYPRKEGAQFAPPEPADAGQRPFAALESLKKRLGRGQP